MFSIIIPTYNNSKVIHRSIESVLRQTMPNFELLIVNDGSNDNTLEKLSAFRDDRIKIITQSNQGVSVARNTGILNAANPWICFLDADDEWLPNHLELLHDQINAYSGKMAFATAYYTQYLDGSREDSSHSYMEFTESICIHDLFSIVADVHTTPLFHTNSMCINKALFDSCGVFVAGVKIGEDTDMWYRIAAYNDIVYLPIATTIYHRESSTATTSNMFNFKWPFINRCKSYIIDTSISADKRKHIKDLYNLYMISKCRQYLLIGDRKRARAALQDIIHPVTQKKYLLVTTAAYVFPHRLLAILARRKNRKYYRTD